MQRYFISMFLIIERQTDSVCIHGSRAMEKEGVEKFALVV